MNKPMTTLLCAIKDPLSYVEGENKFLKIIPSSQYAKFDEYIENVGSLCIEHKLSILEHDITAETDADYMKIDESIKHLFGKCVLSNSLCSLVFASKKETLAFVGVKDQS